jgi:hypothetical protein
MKQWLLFFVGAPAIGFLLLAWANHYGIRWISWQMLALAAIMSLDRQLFYFWLKAREKR